LDHSIINRLNAQESDEWDKDYENFCKTGKWKQEEESEEDKDEVSKV